jgi:hypothetical protein
MERLGGGNDLVDNANELLVEEREGSENAEDEGEEVRSGLRERVALGLMSARRFCRSAYLIGRLPGRKDLVDRGRDIQVVLQDEDGGVRDREGQAGVRREDLLVERDEGFCQLSSNNFNLTLRHRCPPDCGPPSAAQHVDSPCRVPVARPSRTARPVPNDFVPGAGRWTTSFRTTSSPRLRLGAMPCDVACYKCKSCNRAIDMVSTQLASQKSHQARFCMCSSFPRYDTPLGGGGEPSKLCRPVAPHAPHTFTHRAASSHQTRASPGCAASPISNRRSYSWRPVRASLSGGRGVSGEPPCGESCRGSADAQTAGTKFSSTHTSQLTGLDSCYAAHMHHMRPVAFW